MTDATQHTADERSLVGRGMGYVSVDPILCTIEISQSQQCAYLYRLGNISLMGSLDNCIKPPSKFSASQEDIANLMPSLQPHTKNDIMPALTYQSLLMTQCQRSRASNIAHHPPFTRWQSSCRVQPGADKYRFRIEMPHDWPAVDGISSVKESFGGDLRLGQWFAMV
jgi:hypothetical protein